MATGAGYKSKTAFRKEGIQVAYATPVECGADHLMPIIPPIGLTREIIKEHDNAIRAKAGLGSSNVTLKSVTGSCEFNMVYRGIESLLVCSTGISIKPTTVDTGVYKHDFNMSENMQTEPFMAGYGVLAGDGFLAGDKLTRRGTLCIDKAVSPIWEYISTMIQTATIRGSAKGIRLSLDCIPYNLDLGSATNTSSSSWAAPANEWDPLLFQDMIMWLDDYSDSVPLTSADALGITDFEVKIENNLTITQDSQSGLYIAEPHRSDKRLVTGSFSFPRYESDTLWDDLDAQNAMMAMIKFVGPEIGATGYYNTFWIWLPTIRFDTVDSPVEGAGLMPVKHTFTAEIPAAVPSGFPTTCTKEMLWQLQNNLATNPDLL